MAKKRALHSPELSLEDAEWINDPRLAQMVHAVKWEIKDGEPVKTKTGKCFPLPEQEIYAQNLVRFLNAEIAYNNGSWRVVWTQPRPKYYDRLSGLYRVAVPELLECHYLDRDGDTQVVMDIEEDVWTLLENFSFTDMANLCDSAYEQAMEVHKVVGAKPEQMYSPVHGERELNPNERIADLF